MEDPVHISDDLLSEEERWYFDLRGFIVLRQVVAPETLRAMLTVTEEWMDAREEDIPAPLVRYRQEPYKTHIDHIQYGHVLFQELAMNPQILRVVAGLQMGAPRLFHCNFTHMTRGQNEAWDFHRDDSGFKLPTGFRNPHNDYQACNGQIYCSHLVNWIALCDIPRGAGFTVVPGTHKSSFNAPSDFTVQGDPDLITSVELEAGDCIVCATNVLHNARPWTLDTPRLNVFQRYQLSVYFNETGKEGYPLETYRDQISDDLYELESLAKETKQAVRRMFDTLL